MDRYKNQDNTSRQRTSCEGSLVKMKGQTKNITPMLHRDGVGVTVKREHAPRSSDRTPRTSTSRKAFWRLQTILLCRLESASRAAKLDGRRPPAILTWQHLLQVRASMNRGKTPGLDRVAPEMIMALPWNAQRIIRQTFERRYMGVDPTCGIVAGTASVIFLPEKHAKQVTQLAGTDVRHLFTEHTVQVVLRMLVQHDSNLCFSTNCSRNWGLRKVCTYGYEEGRSATEIACDADGSWLLLLTSGSIDMQLHVASLDLNQAYSSCHARTICVTATGGQCNTSNTGDGTAAAWTGCRTEHGELPGDRGRRCRL